MFEKMSDGDVMVYLRNTMLALINLAEERGIKISVDCVPGKDYGCVRAGEYEVDYIEGEDKYCYRPIDMVPFWKYGISPQQISFGQAPKEEQR